MALFYWFSQLDAITFSGRFRQSLAELGLDIEPELASERLIYARERRKAGVHHRSLVTVLVSQVDGSCGDFQIEVRSAECMSRKNTRCQRFAEAVRSFAPPSF